MSSTSSIAPAPLPEQWVYIGTYTEKLPHVNGRAEGIYHAKFNPNTGVLRVLGVTPGIANPSFLAYHPTQSVLYAVSEATGTTGVVIAFAINPSTGALSEINRQSTHGHSPCHVAIDASGCYAFTANYVSGNVCMYAIQANGGLQPASDVQQHVGGSVNASRQEGPHAHSITIDAQNRHLIVADLGMDKLMVYTWDTATNKLVNTGFGATPAGAGPRHIVFHPAGWVYAINELDSTLTVFAYNAANGALTPVETVSTLPSDFTGSSYCADIHLAASGKFLYGSNRGHDSIAIFAIDASTGTLTALGHESTQGQFPRNFAIDPFGKYLLAANQNSSSIAVYHIDANTGRLTPTGQVLDVPTPVCVAFR